MGQISLNAWAKKYNVSCTKSQKMANNGEIPVTIKPTKGGLNRMLIDEDYVPNLPIVTCVLCNREMQQITSTHLKSHGYSLEQYQKEFPNNPIITEETSKKISSAISSMVRTQEHCDNISKAKKGIRVENSRYEKGKFFASDATKQKMAIAHTGLTHTQEAKDKIGDAHRGKTISEEHIRKTQETWVQKMLDGFVAPFKGMNHTEENKELLRQKSIERHKNMSAEQKSEIAAKKSASLVGIKRTEEQKKRYRAATIKRMEENPESFAMMRDTQLELNFAAWCEEMKIECKKQCFITFEEERHPYDFYLPEFKLLVECDGPHHWSHTWFPVKDKTKEEAFEEQQRKDQFWTRAAVELGYSIVRLRGVTEVGDEGSGSIEEQIEEWLSI